MERNESTKTSSRVRSWSMGVLPVLVLIIWYIAFQVLGETADGLDLVFVLLGVEALLALSVGIIFRSAATAQAAAKYSL